MKIQEERVQLIPLNAIILPRLSSRKWKNPEEFQSLCASVKAKGIIIPIIVREKGSNFELIKGGRRFEAAQKAGLKNIPSFVREVSNQELLFLRLDTGLNQEKLSVFDEAFLYHELLETEKIEPREVARRRNVSTDHISDRIKLLSLDDYVQEKVFRGEISLTKAIAMANAKLSKEEQKKHADFCIKHRLSSREFAAKIRTSSGKEQISRHVRGSTSKSIEASMKYIIDQLEAIAEDVQHRGPEEKRIIGKRANEIKKLAVKILSKTESLKRRQDNGKNHRAVRT